MLSWPDSRSISTAHGALEIQHARFHMTNLASDACLFPLVPATYIRLYDIDSRHRPARMSSPHRHALPPVFYMHRELWSHLLLLLLLLRELQGSGPLPTGWTEPLP